MSSTSSSLPAGRCEGRGELQCTAWLTPTGSDAKTPAPWLSRWEPLSDRPGALEPAARWVKEVYVGAVAPLMVVLAVTFTTGHWAG
ncbi:hypothetical protein [Streptomyces sp. AS02]|uniref:hypothetical protein n=1 Tax=Streptomyces sp. AS02 TaxID=2938946 RepID=UPI0020214A8D|nr:hypothetical protein [Streptomyces sp. AS02]MCL8010917.1 hypothetical protein [Streptomyces sp. AS02]